MTPSLAHSISLLGGCAAFAACAVDATAPREGTRVPASTVQDRLPNGDEASGLFLKRGVADPEVFEVCNGAPYSSLVQLATLPTITLDVRVIRATPVPPFTIQLNDGECRDIWRHGTATADVVAVTQRPVPGFPTVFVREVFRNSRYTRQWPALGNVTASRVSGTEGAMVYFGYASLPSGQFPTSPGPQPGVEDNAYFEVCNGNEGIGNPDPWPDITIDVTLAGASPPVQFAVTIPGLQCRDIWVNGASTADVVTVTQRPIPGYVTRYSIGTMPGYEAGYTVTGPVANSFGILLWFYNSTK